MLLDYDSVTVRADWRVEEKIPAGYCRVYYVYGGEVYYADSQLQTSLRPGHLYIFPSAAPYRMRQNAADPLRCTFMHIDIAPATVTRLIDCTVEAGGLLEHMLEAFADAIHMEESKLARALAEVFELYLTERGLVEAPVRPLAKVLRFIAEHITEHISLGRLSALAGYNEQYFVRLFRKSIGLTPYQYIISQRMKAARILLANGESITRTAEMTGYRDIKSFSRAFKKGVGMTPSAFRRNNTVSP